MRRAGMVPVKGRKPVVDDILEKLTWLGHDAFRLEAGGQTIYFDPFRLKGSPPPADLICISHEHYDHCSPEDVARIQGPRTVVLTEPQAAKKLAGDVRSLKVGERVTLGSVTVETVAAYNTNKKFHPHGNHWLGFVVSVAGVRIYHAGDTDLIPEMKGIKADIALLPVSGTYVMTAEEAVEAALLIRPQVAIPMHYGAGVVGTADDAARFARGLAGKVRVELLPRH
ncbi:MAG: MBL fold metallo-hydrolase [Thermodesulfobacteriota bacterium]